VARAVAIGASGAGVALCRVRGSRIRTAYPP
jgi:hypothetical protein